MRGDASTIKERLDIAEFLSGYVKLEKAGASLKARCPFHNEKTPSFFVSPARQSYYCFGCGAKGDIFSFVEEVEGLDFLGALKFLADKAGVELEYRRGESKTEKDKLANVLEEATKFFENELAGNEPARHYIESRGISEETVKEWRIGYAPALWRSLLDHLGSLGYDKAIMIKAGLVKVSDDKANKEPYDVFRDRLIFPLSDQNGRVIAFSGRALSKETEPKYLNSPDTPLFTKSEVLYGLDKAKDHVRKKDYAVLVEGQIDLVLSHQSGVRNTVASSGTAFTRVHLERLKRFSSRIILAFDGDSAGEIAAEKASALGISLGLEVKVARLPEGQDPAEVAERNPEEWKDILRNSLPAIEFFFNKLEEKERDSRKLGKLIEKRILPMVKRLSSSIEQSHFISMLAKRTGIKEDLLWEDLKRVRITQLETGQETASLDTDKKTKTTQKEDIEARLTEIILWQKELPETSPETTLLKKEAKELKNNLSNIELRATLATLSLALARAEKARDSKLIGELTARISLIHSQMRLLEGEKEML